MMENITNCPHCGRPFEKVGVYELRYYYHDVEDDGVVIGEGCFDETAFKCGYCFGSLNHRETESDDFQIIG